MNNKNSRTASVSSVLWQFPLSWKLIVICIIIGLLAAQFVLIPMQSVNAITDEETLKSMLSEEKISQVNDAVEIKRLIAETDDYLANCPTMQVDPYNLPTLTMQFYVASETGHQRDVCQQYVNLNNAGNLINDLADAMDWNNENGYYAASLSAAIIDNNSFYLSIYNPDASLLDGISDKLCDIVESYVSQISGTYGAYTVKCMNQEITNKISTDIANLQNTIQNRQTSYNNQFKSYTTNFAEDYLQNNLLWTLASQSDGNDYSGNYMNAGGKAVSSAMGSAKCYAIGLIGGFVLGIVIVILRVLTGDYLLSSYELLSEYNLPLLGGLINKRGCIAFDKIFKSRKTKADGPFDEDARIDMAVSRIAAACEKQSTDKIEIVSSSVKKKDADLIKRLEDKLNASGIKVICTGNFIADAKPAEHMNECSNAVIIERIGSAKYKDIEKEIVALAVLKMNIVGVLSLE